MSKHGKSLTQSVLCGWEGSYGDLIIIFFLFLFFPPFSWHALQKDQALLESVDKFLNSVWYSLMDCFWGPQCSCDCSILKRVVKLPPSSNAGELSLLKGVGTAGRPAAWPIYKSAHCYLPQNLLSSQSLSFWFKEMLLNYLRFMQVLKHFILL